MSDYIFTDDNGNAATVDAMAYQSLWYGRYARRLGLTSLQPGCVVRVATQSEILITIIEEIRASIHDGFLDLTIRLANYNVISLNIGPSFLTNIYSNPRDAVITINFDTGMRCRSVEGVVVLLPMGHRVLPLTFSTAMYHNKDTQSYRQNYGE